MKAFRFAIILAVMAVAAAVLAFGQGAAGNASAGPNLRIVDPKPNARLAQNFVTAQYELASPGSTGGSPNFRLQLDRRDAVTTTASSGLEPGPHTLKIDVVDANGIVVPGQHAELQFTVAQPAANPTAALPQADAPVPDAANPPALPAAGSPLPLLSVIGFGVLVGGIASAMRTR